MTNHSDNKASNEKFDFGRLLKEARKSKNHTVEDVSRHLKIAVHIIIALEKNDKEALPAPTYTRGYIRAYTKFLAMPEDKVLATYNRAVPHNAVSDLKPRSSLPGETNSQSPLIKTITIVLIVAGIATLVFGSFQYYQKKVNVLGVQIEEAQDFNNDLQPSSGIHSLNIKQNARLTDDGDLIVDKFDFNELVTESVEPETSDKEVVEVEAAAIEITAIEKTDNSETAAVPAMVTATETNVETGGNEATSNEATNNAEIKTGSDTVEIFAEKGSWVEVRDANKSRLLYNMLPEGGDRVLVGRAPFSISLGNARTTRVIINDIEVDISAYIRSSNTANFEISTQGQRVIFH